jgi:hypothetical protein
VSEQQKRRGVVGARRLFELTREIGGDAEVALRLYSARRP